MGFSHLTYHVRKRDAETRKLNLGAWHYRRKRAPLELGLGHRALERWLQKAEVEQGQVLRKSRQLNPGQVAGLKDYQTPPSRAPSPYIIGLFRTPVRQNSNETLFSLRVNQQGRFHLGLSGRWNVLTKLGGRGVCAFHVSRFLFLHHEATCAEVQLPFYSG